MNSRHLALVAAVCGLATLTAPSYSQPFWAQYGRNAQHTGIVTTGVQTMNSVLWQAPVDLQPPYNGSDLLIHYGSPLIASSGTVVFPVRTGPNSTWPTNGDTYEFQGRNPNTGALVFNISTDFTDWMPHDWTPDIGAAVDSTNKLYFPGAGGTIWVKANADSGSATISRLCFYGLSNYTASPTAFNANVQICTPITVDSANNIYFGFYVASTFGKSQGNSLGLASGVAKISASGVATWVTADSATGNTGDEIATNCTPAISNDGRYLYVAAKQAGPFTYTNPSLLRLNTSNLTTASVVPLAGPTATNGDATTAYILDDGTATPTVGPDGDVYYGIWFSIIERGFMLHYSGDLSTGKTPSAFGWDDTSAIVPASAVPGYTGFSKYLILTKYNNYADAGANGDGQNKLALLDPNATETWTATYNPSYTGQQDNDVFTVMNEVQTLLGITPNTSGGLAGVREWCINMAAIDVANKSAIINSEDGHSYRWDFLSNSITDTVNLEPPTGEAYTMTISGKDGLAFAINNATLFAMWDGVKPQTVSTNAGTVIGGNGTTGTVQLTGPTTGPGATIFLSSSNPNVTVPASVHIGTTGQTANFAITTKAVDGNETATITASRYGFTASAVLTITSSSLYSLNLSPTVVYGNQVGVGTVFLSGAAPSSGRTVTLSTTLSSISLGTTSMTISNGANSSKFKFTATPVSFNQTGQITAKLDDGTTVSTTVTNRAPLLTGISLSPSVVVGGKSTAATLTTLHPAPSGGVNVAMSYSAHSYGPGTINVPTSDTGSATINTTSVTSSVTETITASFGGVTKTAQITVTPAVTLTGFTINNSTIFMTDSVTGTATIAAPATGSTTLEASASDSQVVVSNPAVAKGQSSVNFTIMTRPLTTDSAHNSSITISAGGKSITKSITINPITVTGATPASSTLHAGQTTTLTINLSQPAGNGDLGIQLKSSNPGLLSVPAATVFPAQGASSIQVTLTAAKTVNSSSTVTITITLAGVATAKTLNVEP